MNPLTSKSELPTQVTRRKCPDTTVAASSWLIVPRYVVAGTGEDAPNTKLNIAGIGVGGMGEGRLSHPSGIGEHRRALRCGSQLLLQHDLT
jgi:hypothetical protein